MDINPYFDLGTLFGFDLVGEGAVGIVVLLFKFMFSLLSLFYIIFAFVIVRQIKIMNETVETPLGVVFSILGWLHLAMALAIAILVFILL